MRAGIVLVSIGLILGVSVLAPFLVKIATVLVASLILVVVLDLGFQFGALYSLIFVAIGLLLIVLFLTRKVKRGMVSDKTVSYAPGKAA